MNLASTTIADLRATFRAKVPDGPVLVRPESGFYETSEPEIQKVIDDVERLFLQKSLGEEPTPLEQFALRVLAESYF